MKKTNDPLEKVFDNLWENMPPTDVQKEKMLSHVLMSNRLHASTFGENIERWVAVYPWRFAFSAATIQAIVLTLIFGAKYTNLLLLAFGG